MNHPVLAIATRSAPRTLALAQAVVDRSGIKTNPYFTRLADGTMPLAEFQVSQEQFGHAVRYFSRAMAALIPRIDAWDRRIDILHNVWEEHGEGVHADSHDASITNFCRSIRHEPDAGRPVWPCVLAFNAACAGACGYLPVDTGVAMMGTIELSFAWISSHIGGHALRRGWVQGDRLWHYALHERIDPRHAEEFYLVLEDGLDDPRRRSDIQAGLRLGCHAFDRLYLDLDADAQGMIQAGNTRWS